MKINVTVDLSDFYQEDEEGESFSEQIKTEIAYMVKQEVCKDWKSKITDEFTKHVVTEIEKSKTSLVDDTLRELAVNAKVKKRYNPNKMISIVDYIKEELARGRLSDEQVSSFIDRETRNENNRLEVLAKKITKELRDRYDLSFASQIVSKLNDNGMLKKDVAKLILDK